MNIKQKQYLQKRVEKIRENKLANINADYAELKLSISKTHIAADLFNSKGIRKDLSEFIEKEFDDNYTKENEYYQPTINLYELINPKELEKELKKRKTHNAKVEFQKAKAAQSLEDYVSNLKDQIWFGSDEEALRIINEFNNKTF